METSHEKHHTWKGLNPYGDVELQTLLKRDYSYQTLELEMQSHKNKPTFELRYAEIVKVKKH